MNMVPSPYVLDGQQYFCGPAAGEYNLTVGARWAYQVFGLMSDAGILTTIDHAYPIADGADDSEYRADVDLQRGQSDKKADEQNQPAGAVSTRNSRSNDERFFDREVAFRAAFPAIIASR